jgi:uncharacterized membrane protein YhdT
MSSLDVKVSVKIYNLAISISLNFLKTWVVHELKNGIGSKGVPLFLEISCKVCEVHN